MKQLAALLTATLFASFILAGCGGSGGDNPPPPTEANLAVTLDPPNGSVQAPSLGPFTLKVNITSAMPANGVKIEISAKKDDGSGSTPFYTNTANTSGAVNNYTITGTPLNTQCLVEVKVTSLTKATNTWSGSYRYASK